MNTKKIKIMIIGDHILSPSGVGTQIKHMVDFLHKTGKYQFICLGGAIKHPDYRPQKIDLYGEDLIIYPVDGYGNQDIIRSVLRTQKPDILWFMTDPRFYDWLWDIEDEIRACVPMVYYHVWDNYPYPKFNKPFYDSNDVIVSISKLTSDIVKTVAPNVQELYLPHSVDTNIFTKYDSQELAQFKSENFQNKFVVFWNSRNAKRKMSGSVLWWFADFLNKVGKDKASLLMHTDPKDPNGQDLEAILNELDLVNGEVKFSASRISQQEMSLLYNVADVTVNISDAEGFGLSCLESLACETPVIANLTGGLTEQIRNDRGDTFGIAIKSSSSAIIGSQQVPFIYEDRVSKEDFISALETMYNMTKEKRSELGKKGREHIIENYNPDIFLPKWDELFTKIYNELGSWETRKHANWTLKKV